MNNRNLLKGLLLVVIAVVFGIGALRYPIGHVERAGPGFFPLMVSSILLVLGLSMAVRAHFTERVGVHFNVRNLVIILASLVGFAIGSAFVNMILGIVILVFGSAFAGSTYSVRRNTMIAAVLVGVAFIFQKGLGLQLPLY